MVESLFTKEHIDSTRPRIQQTVDALLDTLIKEGGSKPFDIVEKFALPVPSYVSPPVPTPFPHYLIQPDHLWHPRHSLQRPSLPNQPSSHPFQWLSNSIRSRRRKRLPNILHRQSRDPPPRNAPRRPNLPPRHNQTNPRQPHQRRRNIHRLPPPRRRQRNHGLHDWPRHRDAPRTPRLTRALHLGPR
jgi:hypothetical protein